MKISVIAQSLSKHLDILPLLKELADFGYQILIFSKNYHPYIIQHVNIYYFYLDKYNNKYSQNTVILDLDNSFELKPAIKKVDLKYYKDKILGTQEFINFIKPLLPDNTYETNYTIKSNYEKLPYKICWVVDHPNIYKDPLDNPSYRILVHNQNLEFQKVFKQADVIDSLTNDIFNYDICIFVRFGKEEYELIKKLKEQNKTVIFLHDENLYNYPYLEETWKLVDKIACTSKRLADKIINKDKIFLNNKNFDLVQKNYFHSYNRNDPIIGWCGLSGSQLIRSAIKPLMERNNLKFEVISDLHELRKDLTTYNWNKETYIDYLNSFDIFVAPQDHINFYAKSHIKITIPAFLGIPILASPLDSYQDLIEHGETGFYCYTFEDWENYSVLLKDKELRKQMGLKLRNKFNILYGMNQSTLNWINLIKGLIK